MARPKRTNMLGIEQYRAEVARLYLQGVPTVKIAEKFSVTRQQIGYDLKKLRQRWLDSSMRDINADRVKELAKIDLAESEYWHAWERSKADHIVKGKRLQRPAGTTTGGDEETFARTEARVGDPRFLEGVLSCIEKRCKLLGLHAPEQHEHTFTEGVTDPYERLAELLTGAGISIASINERNISAESD